MSYNARETSLRDGDPYEMYLFQTETRAWRLTSSHETKTYNGEAFTPEAITRTSTSQDRENKSARTKVTIPKAHEVAQMFVPYIPVSPLSLIIYGAHEGEAEVIVTFTGAVQQATFGDNCELSCAPESERLKKKLFQPSFQKPCNRLLYSPACGVNRADYAWPVTLTVVGADGITIVAAEFGDKPDGYFNNGYLEKGFERRMILNHAAQTINIITPFSALVVGDQVTAYPGCNRDYLACDDYNNLDRFLGFDGIPNKNPFNGGIL
jgi:hypothetical protein